MCTALVVCPFKKLKLSSMPKKTHIYASSSKEAGGGGGVFLQNISEHF